MKLIMRLLPVVLLFAGAQAIAQQKMIHSERSLYREVLVYEEGGERCMCFTRACRIGRQSCINLSNPRMFALNYTRMMMGGTLFMGNAPKRVLIIGLGGGSIPTALREILPESQIDVVEIDPAVTRVARKYFGFRDGPKMKVFEQDGRVYVKRALREGTKYDAILLDAFDHEYIPEHLLTKEFLTEVKSLLTPEGVLVGNTFSSSKLYDHESTTYASVFGKFYNLKAANRVVVARPAGLPSDAQLKAKALEYELVLRGFGVDAQAVLPMFTSQPDWDTSARVLTDQYSPANLLNR
jgi:spermidine synthase